MFPLLPTDATSVLLPETGRSLQMDRIKSLQAFKWSSTRDQRSPAAARELCLPEFIISGVLVRPRRAGAHRRTQQGAVSARGLCLGAATLGRSLRTVKVAHDVNTVYSSGNY